MTDNSYKVIVADLKFPMNIGSIARIMSCMNFNDLCLVNPCSGWNSLEAKKYALFGSGILDSCSVNYSLSDVKSSVDVLFGFTRRMGKKRKNPVFLSQLRKIIDTCYSDKKTGLVFGGEASGLSSYDLDLCDYIVTIDTDVVDRSLSLPGAVSIILYELKRIKKSDIQDLVESNKQVSALTKKIREILKSLEFIDNKDSHKVMPVINNILCRLDLREIRLLHSIFNRGLDE